MEPAEASVEYVPFLAQAASQPGCANRAKHLARVHARMQRNDSTAVAPGVPMVFTYVGFGQRGSFGGSLFDALVRTPRLVMLSQAPRFAPRLSPARHVVVAPYHSTPRAMAAATVGGCEAERPVQLLWMGSPSVANAQATRVRKHILELCRRQHGGCEVSGDRGSGGGGGGGGGVDAGVGSGANDGPREGGARRQLLLARPSSRATAIRGDGVELTTANATAAAAARDGHGARGGGVGVGAPTAKQAMLDAMAGAAFCLVPEGDSPDSSRLFDAVAALCVPLVISDALPVPPSAHDAWPDATVVLSPAAFLDMTSADALLSRARAAIHRPRACRALAALRGDLSGTAMLTLLASHATALTARDDEMSAAYDTLAPPTDAPMRGPTLKLPAAAEAAARSA